MLSLAAVCAGYGRTMKQVAAGAKKRRATRETT
jgi:hypothetical protein